MNRLIVEIPDNNVKERSYICSFLMKLVGVEVAVKAVKEQKNYAIFLSNGRRITVKDSFFNAFPQELSYLSIANIPLKGGVLHSFDMDIHYIFGDNTISIEGDNVVIGADIFASAFFALTRWEEFLKGRESIGDCDENDLFIVKNGFYKHPIVNEYECWLRKTMLFLGETLKEDDKVFGVRYTLDVDNIQQVTWRRVLQSVSKNLHDYNFKGVISCLFNNAIIKAYMADKTRLFKRHITIAEKYGVKNEFYFKCCADGEKGETYTCEDPKLPRIIELVNKHKSIVGFHPSQTTFNNNPQYDTELNRYMQTFCSDTKKGRNHTLLYNITTYLQWINGGFEEISNCGFHKLNGFRAGIGVPFPLFDIYQRTELPLMEYPFEIMDLAVSKRYPNKMMNAWDEVAEIIDNAKKYNCTLGINWHIIVYFSIKRLYQTFSLLEKVLEYALNGNRQKERVCIHKCFDINWLG